MSVALRLYEQLTEAGEDRTRARAIADAFEQLEERYPNLKDVATHGHVREAELRVSLQIKEVEVKLEKEIKEVEAKLEKEIKEVEAKLEKEIKEVEAKLEKEIKEVEARLEKEMKEIEARLQKEIREVDANLRIEIEKVRGEIKAVEIRLTQAIHRHTLWVVGSVGGIIGGIRLLDWFLSHLTL